LVGYEGSFCGQQGFLVDIRALWLMWGLFWLQSAPSPGECFGDIWILAVWPDSWVLLADVRALLTESRALLTRATSQGERFWDIWILSFLADSRALLADVRALLADIRALLLDAGALLTIVSAIARRAFFGYCILRYQLFWQIWGLFWRTWGLFWQTLGVFWRILGLFWQTLSSCGEARPWFSLGLIIGLFSASHEALLCSSLGFFAMIIMLFCAHRRALLYFA